MSWLKTAVSRVVEVGGGNAVTRTVRNYAGNVVSGGSRIFQDRLEGYSYRSYSLTLKSLEENAIYCRGLSRIELLKRWLILFKEAKRSKEISLGDTTIEKDESLSLKDDSMILYVDPGSGREPMNFWEVFLHSQALEGLTLSMILEPPNEEEVCLFLEIFGLCLTGGKEIHFAILSSIQDLGRSFSNFQDEVLVKREEMLQFAQGAMSGLKVSADLARIDTEAFHLQQKVDDLVKLLNVSSEAHESKTGKETSPSLDFFKEAAAEIDICSKLESLLLEKKSITVGDSPHTHFQKIDKLKILAESLENSCQKAENRISEHRKQKEEAVDYRVAKAKEVSETEKELTDEISVLEKKRDDLQNELEKVQTALMGALTRLKKTREERDRFDDASNKILIHLKTKEDDLLRSIVLCKVEANVVRTWINFLEDTWLLQSSQTEEKDQKLNGELEKYGKCFLKVINHHVFTCKEELRPLIAQMKTSSCNLRDFNEGLDTALTPDTALPTEPNHKKALEEEYLELEAKIITIFSVVDNIKELLIAKPKHAPSPRDDFNEINKILVDIEKLRAEFGSVGRPTLDIETTSVKQATPARDNLQRSSSSRLWKMGSSKGKELKTSQSSVIMAYNELDPEGALAKLETEFQTDSKDNTVGDIEGWEFDD